ncbi:MAG: hypothetical protein GX786_02580 [Clostridiales bacterium]|nr:hypothetical protein [Clostridiales bacterium]
MTKLVWRRQKAKASAVIGLGSNSTRMLVCQSNNPNRIIDRGYALTRLFEGLDENRILSEKSIQKTLKAIIDMYSGANSKFDIHQFWIFATSALRDAKNKEEIVTPVYQRTGIEIDIITGEEEAYYSFLGAGVHQKENQPYGVIDIGGGSTEIAAGTKKTKPKAISMQLGVMRLLKAYPQVDLGNVDDLLKEIYRIVLMHKDLLFTNKVDTFVGVGGTFSTLEMLYDQRKIRGRSYFSKQQVYQKMVDLFSLSKEEREGYPFMPKGRGDITPYGFAILYTLMEVLSFSSVEVVRKGNLDGWLVAHV